MKTQSGNYLENLSQSIKRSVTLKLLSIFIMMMLLLIPVSIIKSVIQEREDLRQETISEVSNQWANGQTVYGPILTIPLQKKVIENEKVIIIHEQAHILPSRLEVGGTVTPRNLRRGIYEVVVYDSRLSFSGQFSEIEEHLSTLKDYEAFPQEAFLTIHISDLRGVKEKVVFNWNGQKKNVVPGSGIPLMVSSGITIKDILGQGNNPTDEFSFDLQLQGSQFLNFIPLGKETAIHLDSEWKAPSFTGSFLPENRIVTDEGFTADW
ncbi:MAG: inner membrane CreD family protein, partial [Bacteroidales bacterium]